MLCSQEPFKSVETEVEKEEIKKQRAKDLIKQYLQHPQLKDLTVLYTACKGLEESCQAILADEATAPGTAEEDVTASVASLKMARPCCANLVAMMALWRIAGVGEQRSQICEQADTSLSGEHVMPKLRDLLRSARLGRGTWSK